VNGITGMGLEQVKDAIVQMADNPCTADPAAISYDSHLQEAIVQVKEYVQELHSEELSDRQCRWLAIKLLEGDDAILEKEGDHAHLAEMVRRKRYDLARDHSDDCEMLFADAR